MSPLRRRRSSSAPPDADIDLDDGPDLDDHPRGASPTRAGTPAAERPTPAPPPPSPSKRWGPHAEGRNEDHAGGDLLAELSERVRRVEARVARVERQVEELLATTDAQPDHQDLLELRLHSARLSAELSRTTVSLQAQIDELGSQTATEPDTDDTMIDLTADPPVRRPTRRGGWRPIDD